MEDVLEQYQREFTEDEVLAVMDGTSRQRTRETRVPRPARPGDPAIHDSGYERNGTANLFMLFAPPPGWREVKVTDRRTRRDWARVIRGPVDVTFPGRRIVPVMDSLNVHTVGSLHGTFPPDGAARIAARLEIHHPPKHAGWSDVAEIEIGAMVRQCLDRRIPDRAAMCRQTGAWAERRNRESIHVWNQARIRLFSDFFRFFRVPCAAVPDLSTAFPTGGAVRARRKGPPGRPRPARG